MKTPFDIRTGWPADLEKAAEFLNKNLDYDTMTPGLLREKLYDDPGANPDLCFSAYREGEVVGFLFAVVRQIKDDLYGYIKLVAVEGKCRRQGIGSALYDAAEKALTNVGVSLIRWLDVPLNYFMPGIDPRYTPAICLAWKKGFTQFGESINMVADLTVSEWDTSDEELQLAGKGLEIRRAVKNDKTGLLRFLEQDWLLWQHETLMALENEPPSAHIALRDGEILAFSLHDANNKGTGWFGPMGTHASLRGMGVGSLLLKRCLKDMRQQGYTTAIIPWVGPVAFYAHYVNARIDRVFWRMEKKIK